MFKNYQWILILLFFTSLIFLGNFGFTAVDSWVEIGDGSASGGGISHNAGASECPKIAAMPNGCLVVAWQDYSGGIRSIYVKKWNGTAWVEMGAGSASGGGISSEFNPAENPAILIDSDGNPIIAFEGSNHLGYGEICIYVKKWNGTSWILLGQSELGASSSRYCYKPAIAIGTNGNTVISYTYAAGLISDICAREWNGSEWVTIGNSIYPPGISMGNTGDSDCSDIAIGSDNLPIVVWQDDSNGDNDEIYIRKFNGTIWEEIGAGSASGNGISNTKTASWHPKIALDSAGFPIVTWMEYDYSNTSSKIFVKQWNGVEWQEMGAGSASGNGISGDKIIIAGYPTITMDNEGNPYIAWSGKCGENMDIFIRHWDGTQWVEVSPGSADCGGISLNSTISVYPCITINQASNPVVIWEDQQIGGERDYEIFIKQFAKNYEDLSAPRATNLNVSTMLTSGSETLNFTVDLADNVAIKSASIDDNDILVEGPNGFSQIASLEQPFTTDLPTISPNYKISAPGGIWDESDNGDYTFYVRENQICDTSNNYMTTTTLQKASITVTGNIWEEMPSGSASGGGISNTPGNSSNVKLIQNNKGEIFAFWNDTFNSKPVIYWKKYINNNWIEPVENSASKYGHFGTDVGSFDVAIASDGNPSIIWGFKTATETIVLYGKHFNGSSWEEMGAGSASGSGINNAFLNPHSFSVASDKNGNIIVVWSAYYQDFKGNVYVKKYDGIQWSELGTGSASGYGILKGIFPDVIIDDNGNPIVAAVAGNVFVKKFDGISWVDVGDGSSSGGGISISGASDRPVRLALGLDNQPIATWLNNYKNIYVKKFDGVSWVEMGAGSASGSGVSGNSSASITGMLPLDIAVDSEGHPIVVWGAYISGYGYEIYIRRYNGTYWQEMGVGSGYGYGISTNTGGSYDPSIIVIKQNIPVVVWYDNSPGTSNGNFDIYLKKYCKASDDKTPPYVASYSISNICVTNLTSARFLINYGDNVALNVGSFDNNDIRITGPNGCNEVAKFISSSMNFNGSPRTVTYEITPPGGAWDYADAGQYFIKSEAWQIEDINKNLKSSDYIGSIEVMPIWQEFSNGSASGNGILGSISAGRSPTLIFDAQENPIVSYISWGKVCVRRWNGNAWIDMGEGSGTTGIAIHGNYTPDSKMVLCNDNNPIIVFSNYSSDTQAEIYLLKWNGTSWSEIGGSASGGGISNNYGKSFYPDVVVDKEGNPIVVWQDGYYSIYVRRWDGTAWSEIGKNSATSSGIDGTLAVYESNNPTITLDSEGYPIIAWSESATIDGKSGKAIYVKRWDGTAWIEMGRGSASGAGISNAQLNSMFPKLVTGNGEIFLFWVSEVATTDYKVMVKKWDGNSWIEVGKGSATGVGLINPESKGNYQFSATIGNDGSPIVSWSGTGYNNNYQIFVKKWDGEHWAEVGPGSASGYGISANIENYSYAYTPAIALDNSENPAILWYYKDHLYLRYLALCASLKANDIRKEGGTTHTLEISYKTKSGVDISTLDNFDIRVKGPNGFEQIAYLKNYDANTTKTVVATYEINAPGGLWDLPDEGEYSVWLEPYQVSDTGGTFFANGRLGSFDADFPKITLEDLQKHMLGKEFIPLEKIFDADYNKDGVIDIADIIQLINWLQ